MKYYLGVFNILISLLLTTGPALAVESAPVSASVPASSFNPPTLVAPANNATINTTRPTFSWSRPSPAPTSPLNHYDLFIDGAFFANISDSVSSEEYYFYSVYRSDSTFYLTLKSDLSQGYHTWSVTAYNDASITSSSETRTFYIDSIPPFISITKVDNQSLNWSTADSSTIPPIENRQIIVTSANALVKGSVELSANLQAVLICPEGLSGCSNQIFSGNISSGNWETTFTNLVPNNPYTVRVSATDAASNSTTFPDFYITYLTSGQATPTIPTSTPSLPATPYPTITLAPTGAATPIPSITSTEPTLTLPSATATPPPGLLTILTPTPFIPAVPTAPTPPPRTVRAPLTVSPDLFYLFLIILLLFGVLIHLLMAIIGTGTPIRFILKFILTLIFPFFRKSKYQTTPFAFIDFYVSDQLAKPWQSVVSDIRGNYSLKTPIPTSLFISITALNRYWKDDLYKGSLIPITCLFPIPVRSIELKRLRGTIYDLRIIPLIIALLSAIVALFISPSYTLFGIFFICLLLLFSQYFYANR